MSLYKRCQPPKKKKGGKKKKKEASLEDAIDLNENIRFNYKQALAILGLQPHPTLLKAINNDADPTAPIVELCVDVELGAPGLRAFCAALLARGRDMKIPGYKHLKSLRLWRAGIGDAGVAAVAEVIRNGEKDCPLESVEFMDCGVGPAGCASLANALILGGNATLKTLRLDINPGIGDAGLVALCKGLRANRTLTRLTASYCSLGPAAAVALAEAVVSPISALEAADLMGNALGSDGLLALALAARRSKALKFLGLADNGIGGGYLVTAALAHGLLPGQTAPAGLDASHPLLAGPPPRKSYLRKERPEFDPATGRLNPTDPDPAEEEEAAAEGEEGAAAEGEEGAPEGEGGAASPGPSEDGEEGGAEVGGGDEDASPSPGGGDDDDDEGGGGGGDDDDGGGGGGDDDGDGGGDDGEGGGDDDGDASPSDTGLTPAVRQPPRAPAVPGAPFDFGGAVLASCQGALVTLGEALLDTHCGLSMVNLEMNALSAAEAEVLLPYLAPENAKVLVFKVDTTLPAALFKALYRNAPPKKKGTKGKKKKGGKKKKK